MSTRYVVESHKAEADSGWLQKRLSIVGIGFRRGDMDQDWMLANNGAVRNRARLLQRGKDFELAGVAWPLL